MREAWQDFDVVLSDSPQDLVARLVTLHRLLLEWIDSADHLIEQHAHAPPIHGETVALGLDYLGGKILGRAAECVCHAVCWLTHLR